MVIKKSCAVLSRLLAGSRLRYVLAGMLLLIAPVALSAQAQPATVILVRHAEKAAEPKDDPPLSAQGRQRVAALLEVLRSSDVSVIYSTPRLRNLETARPIADSLHATIVQVPIESGKADAYAADLVQRVRRDGGGRVSLVVGHSNTFGPVIKAFGGPEIGEIVDDRYDDLFVLTVQDGKPLKLVRAKFGERWSEAP